MAFSLRAGDDMTWAAPENVACARVPVRRLKQLGSYDSSVPTHFDCLMNSHFDIRLHFIKGANKESCHGLCHVHQVTSECSALVVLLTSHANEHACSPGFRMQPQPVKA
eukprot:1146662-Pelagomonas_calceolata.AAC.1